MPTRPPCPLNACAALPAYAARVTRYARITSDHVAVRDAQDERLDFTSAEIGVEQVDGRDAVERWRRRPQPLGDRVVVGEEFAGEMLDPNYTHDLFRLLRGQPRAYALLAGDG